MENLDSSTQEIEWLDENVNYVKIEYSVDNGQNWSVIRHSIASTGSYNWIVDSPDPSTDCLLRISNRDYNNIFDVSDSVFTIANPSGIQTEYSGLPTEYDLMQNYPNPFNSVSTIYYALPSESFVVIKIFDVLGNEIVILESELKQAGYHNIKFDVLNLPSGIYFYRLKAGDFIQAKKMVLMK